MTFTQQQGDLFELADEYYLAHCISSDFAMGRGVAVEFVRRYDMKSKLKEKFPFGAVNKHGEWLNICIKEDRVFNLVTKQKYWQKPNYVTLENAVIDMRDQAVRLGITKIAMPKIGCGLDRLSWTKVSEIIKKVFANTDIDIIVRYL
ncbi:MAG: macro domain-containing protein [Acutalibacteraceae bacterium]